MKSLDIYKTAKKANTDALVLVKAGDWYESYHADASLLQDVTGRGFSKRDEALMSAIPFHELDATIKALNKRGITVVTAEKT